jgi:Na+/H+ antiporter NhaB
MENLELAVVIFAVVLPIYPGLWTIYRKIGQYDAMCADFERIRDEHMKNHYQEQKHGTRTLIDN